MHCPPQTLRFAHEKYLNPKGKDRLPSTIFQGRFVKLPGCIFIYIYINIYMIQYIYSIHLEPERFT